jgi:hypothetical protein
MEKITLSNYPSFCDTTHVIDAIKKVDKPFALSLINHTGSFATDEYFFTPAMDSYLLVIPFSYKGETVKYGKAISEDFKKMRDERTKG